MVFAVAFPLFPFFEEGEGELWLDSVVAVMWWGVGCGRVDGRFRKGEAGKEKKAEQSRASPVSRRARPKRRT